MRSVNKISQRRKYKILIGLIVGLVILVILIIIIATIIHSKSSDEVVSTTITETTTNFNPIYEVVGETTFSSKDIPEETTTFSNNFMVIPESTKAKNKRKRQSPTSDTNIVVPNTQMEPNPNTYQPSVPNATKQITQRPNTTKRKSTKVPTQYEKGLTSTKRNLIRNGVLENVSGRKEPNINNLAIYMANNCISYTSTALNTLNLDSEYSLSAKLATYTAETTDNIALIEAASVLASKIGSINCSRYGIGVSCVFSGNKYHMTVTVVYY